MIRRLTHVGIAVNDAGQSSALFAKLLGIGVGHRAEVEDQNVQLVFFEVGETGIELLQPTAGDSPIARFIEKRGEGIHHLSFEVDDIRSEIARLTSAGFRMIDEQPRVGADGFEIAFLHPKSTNGVLIEISQKMARENL